MVPTKDRPLFVRKMTVTNDHPHIYIASFSQDEGVADQPAGPSPGKEPGDTRPLPRASFLGYHIGKLLAPDKATEEEFLIIDKEIQSSEEVVRKKLEQARPDRTKKEWIVKEEEKHLRYIEERNLAQEEMFQDILQCHIQFKTGLNSSDLRSL
jgi:hypothetical protein